MRKDPGVVIESHSRRPIDPAAVQALYTAEGWWPERTAADLGTVLSRGPAVGAWMGDQLVGFARAVTDGRFRAYVEDVVVAAPHRGRGLGTMLIDRLHEQLREVDVVSLFCDPTLVRLYRERGYQPTRQVVAHRRRTHAPAER